jgi:hypothetical protein
MGKPWEKGDLYGKSPFLMGKKWGFYVNGLVFLGKSTGDPWFFTMKCKGFRLNFSHHPIL